MKITYATRPLALALVAGTILALTPGCAANTDSEAAPNEEAVGTTAEGFQVQSYTWALPFQGGTGGQDHWVSCGAGNVAVGLWGTTTQPPGSDSYQFVDSIGLICAHLNANGTFSPSWTVGPVGGNSNYYFYSNCGASALMGIWGFSHTYLDFIGSECEPVTHLSTFNPISTGGYGGPGGDGFEDYCPAGYAVTYMKVRSGSLVDGVQLYCQYIAP
jgi:hypothetical protein